MNTRRLAIIFCLIFLTVVLCIVLVNSYRNRDIQTYTDKQFNFSVQFPKDWSYTIEDTWEATSEHEASPDGGIYIYVEGVQTDTIRVYGQHGHIGYNKGLLDYEQEEFKTNDDIKGDLRYKVADGRKRMSLVLGNGFHGAHVDVSLESYNKYKQEIMNILRSIEIT